MPNVRSAIYYPHTSVRSEALLKNALLLWDDLHFIVPRRGFRPHYENPLVAEAMELFGVAHKPTTQEQAATHRQLELALDMKLPKEFFADTMRDGETYLMYPQKLPDQTWDMLRDQGMIANFRIDMDNVMSPFGGLLVMSILADSCAGETKARITDRDSAYRAMNALLAEELRGRPDEAQARSILVGISLDVMDTSQIDLESLVKFRKRESKQTNKSLLALRHHYSDTIEAYVGELTKPNLVLSEVEDIREDFRSSLAKDLGHLREEMGFAKRSLATAKELWATAVAGVGLMNAPAIAGASADYSGAFAAAGGIVAIAGIASSTNAFLKTRVDALRRHPMGYLYSIGNR